MNKKILIPIIVLVSICVVVAALLGATNLLTKDKIAENALKKEQAALFEVLPAETDGFETLNLSGLPSTVKTVYKGKSGAGYVISLATTSQYSEGDMAFVVGLDNGGNIVSVKILGYYETKDFGKESYPQSFVGKTSGDYQSIPTVSGVTYSSKAFKDAMGDAFVAFAIAKGDKVEEPLPEEPEVQEPTPEEPVVEVLPKTDSEIKAIFEDMAKTGLDLVDITPSDSGALKRIYKDKGGKGYFAYVVTSTQYVKVESEGAVYIDVNGDIADLRLLTWTVGHGVDYTKEYVESFKNKDVWHSDRINLVSEATGTSEHFRDAIFSAVRVATYDMPRTEKKILDLAAEMIQNEKGFEKILLSKDAPSTVKALYKETSGLGYVAYLVTSTQYVARESETIIFVDRFGEIANIKVINWTVGHGIDYTEEFVNSFIGMTKEDFEANTELDKLNKTKYGIQLVSGATGTAEHLADSVRDAMTVIPEPQVPVWRIVAIVLLVLLVASSVVLLVLMKKMRRAPYEK